MSKINRRLVLGRLGGLAAAATASLALPAYARSKAKVVIIGGGFGGASAAMQLRRIAPDIEVTLLEPNSKYFPCPFSNLTIANPDAPLRSVSYDGLAKLGIQIIETRAIAVGAAQKTVRLSGGTALPFDRLIMSPGVDFIWGAIEGYDWRAVQSMPHGWKAGEQTRLLQARLKAMPDGGTFAITIPPPPFRCPPGPYERASLIAGYLKTHKPKSKLLILDAQDKFSKQSLFEQAWREHYPDIIERIPGAESGQLMRIDADARTLHTDFDDLKVDVANVIPPQKAGEIAKIAGAVDPSGWCPIDAVTFESRLVPNIHVIGDAAFASPMPKSAFSASLQGKICAAQVARLLKDQAPIDTTLVNTCYSFTGPEQAISVSGVYHNKGGAFTSVPDAGGTSPLGSHSDVRAREAGHARQWFDRIMTESFGV